MRKTETPAGTLEHMGDLSEYPNLIDNTDQDRCANCNAFVNGIECHRCGPIYKCHCGEYKPVVSEMDTTLRLKCNCTGAGTERVTVKK